MINKNNEITNNEFINKNNAFINKNNDFIEKEK